LFFLMFTLMLAFLIVASLSGSALAFTWSAQEHSVDDGGSDVCTVDPNYLSVDTVIRSFENTTFNKPRNPNFGNFSATAFDNDTVTTTYSSDLLTITIASNSTDRIAGIIGYFADSTRLGTPNVVSPLWVGDWVNNTYLQTYWNGCPHADGIGMDGFSGFSHRNDSYWGLSRSEVSIGWTFNPPVLSSIPHSSAHSDATNDSISFGVTSYPYSGVLYWILLPGNVVGQSPTHEQLQAGLQANGSEAFKSGNMTFTSIANLPAWGNFKVGGLEPSTMYTVYYCSEIINPPTVSFQAYVLSGERGNSSSQQLYRTVAGDSDNLVLRPAAIPLPTRVFEMHRNTSSTSGVAYTSPTMVLISLCLWISSQMFL